MKKILAITILLAGLIGCTKSNDVANNSTTPPPPIQKVPVIIWVYTAGQIDYVTIDGITVMDSTLTLYQVDTVMVSPDSNATVKVYATTYPNRPYDVLTCTDANNNGQGYPLLGYGPLFTFTHVDIENTKYPVIIQTKD